MDAAVQFYRWFRFGIGMGGVIDVLTDGTLRIVNSLKTLEAVEVGCIVLEDVVIPPWYD